MILKTVSSSALLGAFVILITSAAHAESILTPYNVIVSGNFTDTNNIDIGGGLAVGGTITLGAGAFSLVGDALNGESLSDFPSSTSTAGSGSHVQGTTLVTLGGVVTGTIEPDDGNYYVASGNVSACGTCYPAASSPITPADFTSDFSQFVSQSTAWGAMPQTAGDSVTGTTALTVNVNNTGLNVINLTAAQVAAMTSINFVTSGGSAVFATSSTVGNAWVVLNVDTSGITSYTLGLSSGTSFNGTQETGDTAYAAEDVLYNFYGASGTSGVTLGATTVGSVLAPSAGVIGPGNGQQFDGSLVAQSFTGGTNGTEFHNLTFQGGGSTPEPAPVAFVGAGLIALALIRRRA